MVAKCLILIQMVDMVKSSLIIIQAFQNLIVKTLLAHKILDQLKVTRFIPGEKQFSLVVLIERKLFQIALSIHTVGITKERATILAENTWEKMGYLQYRVLNLKDLPQSHCLPQLRFEK